MYRRILVPAAVLAAAGCFQKDTRKEIARPQAASDPVARAVPASAPRLLGPAPVVRTATATEPAAAPPLLAPPADVSDADRKTLRERLQERREERLKDKDKPAPKLPSPIAPAAATKPAADPKPNPKPEAAPAATSATVAASPVGAAAARFRQLPDYECRLVRREVVNGAETAKEEVLFQFRKSPYSVHMKNTGAAGKGREVVYVDGKNDGKMHVVTGEGDSRLMPAGFKTSLKPDSPLAAGKSRHKITEAGFGYTIAKLQAADKAGRLKVLPPTDRKEFPAPVPGVELTLKPGDDPNLPRGGVQKVFFDPDPNSAGYALPCLVLTLDETGREVEYYAFDRVRTPAQLSDADFDPARLGKK